MDMDLDTAVDAIDCGWREKLVRGSIDRSILPEYVGTRLLVARSAQKMSKKKKKSCRRVREFVRSLPWNDE